MSLYDQLLAIPQRETAGSTTPERFQYQYNWALFKLLDLFKESYDFVMFFEFCDDIIILDSSENPEEIDFYQIKTKKQKNILNWTPSDLSNRGTRENPKTSIIEKLIDAYARYEKNTKSIHLVSNLPFKFSDKVISHNGSLKLEDIDENIFTKFQELMCEKCSKVPCKQECKKIMYFDCSALHLENFEETCIGTLSKFLSEQYPNNHINPTALYKSLIDEIEVKSRNLNYTTKEQLIKQKSISKKAFSEKLAEYERNSSFYNNWNNINMSLQNMFGVQKNLKIKQEFDKFRIDCLDTTNEFLSDIICKIRGLVQEKTVKELDDTQLKQTFTEIVDIVKNELDINTKIYNENYLLGIILREFLNG